MIHDIESMIHFILAMTSGFVIAYYVNYKQSNKNLQELILIAKNNCFHIHHFITFSIIILSMLFGYYISGTYLFLVIAFMIGLSIEDLLFKDWYIIKNNCHKKQLLKLFK